ncbi:3-hydroxybutyrate dehydrogenase [Limibacillus halophilus]|uniref:3-hydroxybutyrate dehydrogenase n=1 Tax=Limibacillus halophilus TaxID=1579333 RepID=A0A839SP31_9PROT|nr:3-hydroxybutyrate dehydrogenase [Limibacillus halophilus]MBB3063948.1 3-hydroxybutyrate dehydrogenase [Limibacillus halophilus]
MYDTSFATRPSARRRRALEGRVAIVTGSTSGIGLGIARTLAENGAAVLLNGFGDAEEIERIRGELSLQNDVDVAYDGADMSSPEQIARMVAHANDALGPVDILVNNAGIQHVSPVESFPPHKWDAVIAINLSSAFHMTRLVFAGMKQRGWGRIVNVSSAHGLIASPFKAAYVAAKHGIIGLTKCVALEGAEAGVTCNAICPGYVWTPLVEKQIEDQAKNHGIPREEVIRQILLAQQPNKRFATVEEIGALAAFLCADGGASITGAALPVDGGWTAH